MCGFNNLGFDYPILDLLLRNPHTFDFAQAYNLCQQIIGQNYGNSLHTISMADRIIPQIDLVKINHFDNANRSTPLKSLEFAMRMDSIQDLPVKIGEPLTTEQMDLTLHYNAHDVKATELFLIKCKHLIDLRYDLLNSGVLSGDVLNYSDAKIGTEYLVRKIGRSKCFNGKLPRQTFRNHLAYKDLILPNIEFRTRAYQETLDWFKVQEIFVNSEKENPKLTTKLAGLEFDFGVGGIHASVESKKFESNATHVIKDIDVSGMYVAVAIANGFAPEHLGRDFSDAYKQLQSDRAQYKKGTTMNATLKLAGNAVFGNSDNKYSCFYDPKYPKQITLNGQLQLLQLVEVLSQVPGLQIIQANTDGITAYVPRHLTWLFDFWCRDWERETSLKLEEVEYAKMWIRDVNNYLCIDTKGKIKAKGAYWFPKEEKDYDGVWNKDFSMMVVQKITEQSLINGYNPEALLRFVNDPYDFCIRYKTPKGAKVFIGDQEMDKTVRYYVSTNGAPMRKVAEPKGQGYKRKPGISDEYFNQIVIINGPDYWDERIHTKKKTRYETVITNIENGRLITECNDIRKFNFATIDFDFYLKEIQKLEIT